MSASLARNSEKVFCALRVIIGLLFACHGAQKLLGMFGGQMEWNDPEGVVAGIVELVGGLLVAVGLFTRVAALLASGEMAVAYFKAHAARNWFPINNHGELAVLYCFVFLYVAAHGAGPFSIDRFLNRQRL